jgi:MFS family permease
VLRNAVILNGKSYILSFPRSVADEQRTLALGLQSILFRAFGSIPGPIIFGALFDSVCIYWQFECNRRGNCWVYDNTHLSERAVALAVSGIAANFIFSFFSWLFYPKTVASDPDRAKDLVGVPSGIFDSLSDHGDDSSGESTPSGTSGIRPTKRSSSQRMDSHCSADVLLDSEM